jgi:outer membrane receptor protein involved in Fe transport
MGLRSQLLIGVTCLSGILSAGATAQAQTASSPSSTPSNTQVQEVVVTGSRIARPNLDQPTPISTLSSQQLEDAGTADLGQALANLPSIGTYSGNRANSNNYGNGAGVSEIDLRNLGTSRTLVLVDGQRHVDGDIQSDAVDVNSIPSSLVDHVEVITGGASAIYGSDAVSGVVNIILRHDFEGVELQGEAGNYDAGFGAQYSAHATIGHNFEFLGRNMNVTFAGFYNHEDGIEASDLPYSHNYGLITNPADIPPGTFDPTYFSSGAAITGDHIPDNLLVPNVGSDLLSRNGVLLNPATFLPITGLTAGGVPISQPGRTGYNSFSFGQLPGTCVSCYFGDSTNQVLSPNEQRGFEFITNYDVNSHLHAYVDAKFVDTYTVDLIQGDYSFGSYGIAPDNAFITPQIASVLAPTYAAGGEPLYAAFLNNNREQDLERRTYRVVGGLKGDFDVGLADITWDSALNYGETVSHFDISGIQIVNNFEAALDSVINPATGQPACRVNVPSAQGAGYVAPTLTNPSACVAYNPFGTQASAAANAYSFGRFLTRDFLSQQVANLNLGADSSRFFKFQGGPVAVAFGGEYRMERTYEINDPALNEGLTDELTANSAGGFNVYEGYIEGNFPLFKHYGLGLDELSIDAAFREAHYSTVKDVDAYKVSAIYGPVNWLKFRGTYSSAVRAPNITEAFSPVSPTYYNISDPCSVENISQNVNYAKNCAAAGIPTGFVANTNASIVGQTSGNPDLKPEKSLSYTGGIIFEPPIIPRLSLTADYYSILINDAITDVAAQDEIDNCYNNASGLSSQYCSLFTRGADGNINFVKTTYVNAAKLYTDGIELQIAYSVGVSGLTDRWTYSKWLNGKLGLSIDANYILKLRNYPFQNNPSQFNVWEGEISGSEGDVPQMRALSDVTYRQGPVELSWQARYVGRAARYDKDPTQTDFSEFTNYPYAGAKFFHDITVRYDMSGPLKGMQIFMGVNDLFGETPPLGLVQGAGQDASYDLGRYIYGGLKFRR